MLGNCLKTVHFLSVEALKMEYPNYCRGKVKELIRHYALNISYPVI